MYKMIVAFFVFGFDRFYFVSFFVRCCSNLWSFFWPGSKSLQQYGVHGEPVFEVFIQGVFRATSFASLTTDNKIERRSE